MKKCLQCQKTIYEKNLSYCSHACLVKDKKSVIVDDIFCNNCGVQYKPNKSGYNSAYFCSPNCVAQAEKEAV